MPHHKLPRQSSLLPWFSLLILASLVGILSSCSSEDPDVKPVPALAVRNTSPVQGATAIPPDAAISATFSRDIDVTTVTASTFTVTRDGSSVAGSVAGSGAVAEFVPDSLLVEATTYTATLTTGIADALGNRLPATTVWSFTTAQVDETRPTVVGTAPADAATDVSVNTAVTAMFSESIDPESVSAATFSVKQAGTPVAGVTSSDGATVAFTPADPFEPVTAYTATLNTAIVDDAGNALEADYGWSFTTGQADQSAPVALGTSPADAAQAVPLGAVITVFFSEAVDPATVDETTFTVAEASGAVAGTVAAVDASATFTPAGDLNPSTSYTATLGTGIRDRSGNPLQSASVWTFVTTDKKDRTAPTVQGTTPGADAQDVALGATVTATFSEAIDPASVNGATFRVVDTAGVVNGSFEFNGAVVTFVPAGALESGMVHTATLTGGIADVAGNGLDSNYAWTFTTVAGQDETAPTIVSTFPVDAAQDTPVSTPIFVTFSESIDPATVSDASFFITQPGFPFNILVPGTPTVNGATASFAPDIPLEFARTYTATLTVDITDLAGNPLASAFTWEFVTEAFQDQTPPTVLSTLPQAGAQGVSVTPLILGNFDENIVPATVNATTFTLSWSGGPVAGNVYGGGGVAFFEPDEALRIETEYTATLTTGIQDYSGNALATPYTWTFTTGLDQPPVAVAGQDQEVVPWQSVTLDGSRSFSPAGAAIVDYVWTRVSGSSEVPSVLHGPVVQFYAPSAVGGAAFDLVVSDGRNQSEPQRIEVYVLEKGSGVYVSASGSDTNPGNRPFPKRTIAAALNDAVLLGTDVYVAGGNYVEGIELRSGVSIYGGFEPGNWIHRDLSSFVSVIIGAGNLGARGVDVSDIRLDGLLIQANAAQGSELDTSSSLGMLLLNAHDIDIRGCQIGAGAGATGTDGVAGEDGLDGERGRSGDFGACDDDEAHAGGGSGWGYGGDGGRGGGSWFDPEKAGQDFTDTWFGGADGESGSTPSYPGGATCLPNAGKGKETWDCDNESGTNGRSGCNGPDGAPGTGGFGLGTFVVGPSTVGYRPAPGTDGGRGYQGSGGGGGGGSSGQGDFSLFCLGGGGNGGGGGGNGGRYGSGGSGGGGGGASIALALFNCSNVTVRESTLISKQGGAGGSGGPGGMGGTGGAGGLGGDECVDEIGRGGDGGPGGNGGDGGHGGGGGGGPSVGVVIASSTITIYPSTVTQVGAPGLGGSSAGAVGGNGLVGPLYDLTTFTEFEPAP